ncbi:immunity 52 family protein [Burkholderia multivorans]|nr:immunity 52 family protein [Burkholderia multivorans]MDN7404230.1 immunity 52 family protein [Burkholderia multivorans]MDN7418041.1 immunity 52 family protein [Burkholderia multivorans]MDN7650913.1 immunity 52 family protein [Burkholderia multivorans]MDN7688638.1 immunity 52 family protein [Burkholderia multivorans]
MQFIAQYRESANAAHSDYARQLSRLWPVIEALAAKDARLAEWFLQANSEEEARLYSVYEAPGTPSAAVLAVLTEQYRGEEDLAKTIGIWNGQSAKKDGASLSLGFDTGSMPCDFDLSVGEESATSSRLGNFESIGQIVAAIATAYAPAYVSAAPRKYVSKQVFDDKPGVGWMLYLPKIVTQQQVPEARALIPVPAEGKQAGTIIVSVIDGPFSIDNPEHVEIANRIEIRLVDHDLLPTYAGI